MAAAHEVKISEHLRTAFSNDLSRQENLSELIRTTPLHMFASFFMLQLCNHVSILPLGPKETSGSA
ncbi:hypothetical protein HI914_02049 [Erysiphe necator]|nr:hypothetical protein HI914_02049 [Erysiphe necator]